KLGLGTRSATSSWSNDGNACTWDVVSQSTATSSASTTFCLRHPRATKRPASSSSPAFTRLPSEVRWCTSLRSVIWRSYNDKLRSWNKPTKPWQGEVGALRLRHIYLPVAQPPPTTPLPPVPLEASLPASSSSSSHRHRREEPRTPNR